VIFLDEKSPPLVHYFMLNSVLLGQLPFDNAVECLLSLVVHLISLVGSLIKYLHEGIVAILKDLVVCESLHLVG